jgi:hypothetical protein
VKLSFVALCFTLSWTCAATASEAQLPDGFPEGVPRGGQIFWWGESLKSAVKKCADEHHWKQKDGTTVLKCEHSETDLTTLMFTKSGGKLQAAVFDIDSQTYIELRKQIVRRFGVAAREEDKDGNEFWNFPYANERGKLLGNLMIIEASGRHALSYQRYL